MTKINLYINNLLLFGSLFHILLEYFISCNPLGYLKYIWPEPSWWAGPNLGTCTAYPEDGARLPKTPEQFWNCAQVTINSSGPTTEPTPKGPITEPTSKGPTSEPTSSPPTSKKYQQQQGIGIVVAELVDMLTYQFI